MEDWIQWAIGTLLTLGSLIVAYFSLRKKPDTNQKQTVSKNNLQQSPLAQNINKQVNHFGIEPKSEPIKTNSVERISEHDKKIIQYLFSEALDLDMAQDTLEVQSTWYGYKKSAIKNLFHFFEEASKIRNRISNPQIRNKMEAFHEALEEFLRQCAKRTAEYHSEDWYLYIGREQEGLSEERREQELEKSYYIDELGKTAFEKLTELIDFLRQKDLL